MSVEWIEHKGKEILFIDYRGLSVSRALESLKTATEIILERKQEVLILVDTTDAVTTLHFMAQLKESGKKIKPFVVKQAVVGVVGIKGVLLDAYNRATGGALRPFPTQEEAKEWLVE